MFNQFNHNPISIPTGNHGVTLCASIAILTTIQSQPHALSYFRQKLEHTYVLYTYVSYVCTNIVES